MNLYNGNCLDVMDKLIAEGVKVDAVITSPPYNKKGFTGVKTDNGNHTWKGYAIDYNSYNDNMGRSDYIAWQLAFLAKCALMIADNGSIFYNHKPIRANNEIVFHPMEIISKLSGLKLYQEIIWDRRNSPNVRNDVLLPCTERVYWLVKNKPNVLKNNLQDNYKSEVWLIPPRIDKEHPATFPYQLVENCINLTTKKGQIVLDPFMGSGTTGVACKRLNRDFIGIELDKNYFEIAKNRIEREQELML